MLARRWVTLALIGVLGLALVSCSSGGSSRAQGAATGGSASPTKTATSEASPSSTTQASGRGGQSCTPDQGASTSGDLAISTPSILLGFNPDYMLPDGLSAAKPVTVTMQDNRPQVLDLDITSRPVVAPVPFVVSMCNTSGARAHQITSLGVQLDTMVGYTGALNVVKACALLYSRPFDTGGECAPGFSPDAEASFQFAVTAAPQARVTQTLASAITLAPHQGVSVSFFVNPPAGPAVMTYRLGLGVDGAAVSYPVGLGTPAAVVAPNARHWAGDYCTTPQMQAQIPATVPANTYYICPKP